MFSELKGVTLIRIDGSVGDEEMKFVTNDGQNFLMYHDQDCCENVYVEEIVGDLSDLIGSEILFAEETSNSDRPPPKYSESWTWTFYKLSTIKGSVTIRWLGESNGYYSESVSFVKLGSAGKP